MTWRSQASHLALLELLTTGSLRRRARQAEAWDSLAELPWTKNSGRRGELSLVPERRGELVSLLGRVWPDWGAGLAALTARGLPPTPTGWTALQDALRAEGLPPLPDQLNRRTAAALTASHSKGTLTERRLDALGSTRPTHDGAIRIRPPQGLVARNSLGAVDLAAVATVLGEAALPERALKAGLELQGHLRAVLSIENLGVFADLPALEGWLYVHVPGWDTATATSFLAQLRHVPMLHFGDLDPNGVRIMRHLQTVRPDLHWFVPEFWGEFVESRGLEGEWPEDLALDDAPALVRALARSSTWLEQEALAVDPRTLAELATLV